MTQRLTVLAGLLIGGFLSIYVPWTHTFHINNVRREKPAGYGFIFSPPPTKNSGNDQRWGLRIDLSRTLLPIGFVVVAIGAAIFLVGAGWLATVADRAGC
jgi:hypothetical protein